MEPAEFGYDHDTSGDWCIAHHRYMDHGTCYLDGDEGLDCVLGDELDDEEAGWRPLRPNRPEEDGR